MMPMCCIFSVWGIILLFMIISTVRHNFLHFPGDEQFFHKGSFPMGPLKCVWLHSPKSVRSYVLCERVSNFLKGLQIMVWVCIYKFNNYEIYVNTIGSTNILCETWENKIDTTQNHYFINNANLFIFP